MLKKNSAMKNANIADSFEATNQMPNGPGKTAHNLIWLRAKWQQSSWTTSTEMYVYDFADVIFSE